MLFAAVSSTGGWLLASFGIALMLSIVCVPCMRVKAKKVRKAVNGPKSLLWPHCDFTEETTTAKSGAFRMKLLVFPDVTNGISEPQPAWVWFLFSNFIAMGTFIASGWYLLQFWMDINDFHHSPVHAYMHPGFVVSLICAIASLLYFFAFFGVAFIHTDVESLASPLANPVTQSSAMNPEYDCDVLIVGMGTAGAALATVMARAGKKVVAIERDMNQVDRIVGELMQPGGIRALERMGIADCAKTSAIDPVLVDGYVCITPYTQAEDDLVLTYPARDPQTLSEYFGLLQSDSRKVNINQTHARGEAKDGALNDEPSAMARSNAGAADGVDEQPCGRSFHNHRFVHELRCRAFAEENVDIHLGEAKKLVTLKDLQEAALTFVGTTHLSKTPAEQLQSHFGHLKLNDIRTSAVPAPKFAGYDKAGKSLGSSPAQPLEASAKTAKVSRVNPSTGAEDTIAGVAWVDKNGCEHVTTARLTIVCDGMYSTLRPTLHVHKPVTISHFCGYILHHPHNQTPLPYPNRGHVLMSDPNPVLLYQISATETRVLVDIPGKLPSVEDGSMAAYMLNTIAPQMPKCVRQHFIDAVNSQEPHCMPNRGLPAALIEKRGAVLLGDSWNMRHPLTGGGMTVALKDTELLWRCIKDLDMQGTSWGDIEKNLKYFQVARAQHASTINVLANALYRVFSRPANDADGTRARLRAACIDYLAAGGACTAGPVGLLAGLTPKPSVLVTHFFAVALHAMRRALLPLPTPTKVRQGYDLLHIACIIIMPLLRNEKATFLASQPIQQLVDFLFPWKNVDITKL